MKTNLIKCILVVLTFIFALSGCSKNEDAISSIENVKQDILTFSNVQEFESTLEKLTSMKPEERIAWEKSKVFKSFGTICDEFYKTIEPKNFKTIEDVNTFVASNSDKIQIYENNAGDKYCEVQEFDNALRYLMNSKKMYIIGTKAYRKFNDITITTDLYNFEKLETTSNIDILTSDPNFKVYNNTDNYKNKSLKAISANLTSGSGTGNANIGSETYRVSVAFDAYNYSGQSRVAITVRSFSRFMFIYWGMDAPVNINFKFKTTNSNSNLLDTTFTNSSWVLAAGYEFIAGSITATTSNQPYFVTYDCDVYNTVTTGSGTCNCKVHLVY